VGQNYECLKISKLAVERNFYPEEEFLSKRFNTFLVLFLPAKQTAVETEINGPPPQILFEFE
jgi:hypothetical protein